MFTSLYFDKKKKKKWTIFKPVDTCFKNIFIYIVKPVLRAEGDHFKMSHFSIRYVE
jgi:hypothetical protein